MPSILITGASGLLGRAVRRACAAMPAWQVVGAALTRARAGLERLDLCDAKAVKDYLDARRPAVIVHCAAERHPDRSESDPEATRRLNVEATSRLAKWAAANNAWMIFISTDYVFDGITPPYAPGAMTNPLNSYGRSKRDGELAVWAATTDACVLRVPLLYGAVETLEESAVTGLVPLMRAAAGETALDDWATRYPTLVDDVAETLRQMIERRLAGVALRGAFHWSGAEPLTKYGMARIMARLLEIDAARFKPDSRPPAGAPRPRDCHLDCSDLERLGMGRRTPFGVAIAKALEPWQQPASTAGAR